MSGSIFKVVGDKPYRIYSLTFVFNDAVLQRTSDLSDMCCGRQSEAEKELEMNKMYR